MPQNKPVAACGNCVCFVKDAMKSEGQCHLNPPQIVSVSHKSLQGMALVPGAMFPQVGVDWWCMRFAAATTVPNVKADS